MSILLDTCALLWLASGDASLSGNARLRITDAAIAYVSVMSGFEISLKCRRGKRELPATPDEWMRGILEQHGLTVLPLTLPDAVRAPQLPDIHRDPCDRLIIAAALRLALPVVTGDPRFGDYGVTVIS